ncbi:unnamed protein product [Closterium sp. NIES-53]
MKRLTAGGSAGSSSGSVSTSGDPRRPDAVKKYVPPVVNAEDLPIDMASMMAIFFGIAGVMMRQKLACWLALLCAAQALANMKYVEHDLKQIITALSFAVMGIVTNYFAPVPVHPDAIAAGQQG